MGTFVRLFFMLIVASFIGHIIYEVTFDWTKHKVRKYLNKQAYTQYTYPEPNKVRAEIKKQQICLANNIYYEAGIEPKKGKLAVAQVTMNRVASGDFPNSICKVVSQKTVKKKKKVQVCQFSWKCQNVSKPKPTDLAYRESQEIARKFLSNKHAIPELKDALYYHADYVNPGWKKERITKIGKHIFYR